MYYSFALVHEVPPFVYYRFVGFKIFQKAFRISTITLLSFACLIFSLINIAIDKIIAMSDVTLDIINVRVVSYLKTDKPLTITDRTQFDRNRKYGFPNLLHG